MSNQEEAARVGAVMTLTDFLLARIAEDEDEATRAMTLSDEGITPRLWGNDMESVVVVVPSRLLAEVEAKRGIIEVHQLANADQGGGVGCTHCDWDREWGMPTTGGCDTLRYLASPYADHPDYREEWRP